MCIARLSTVIGLSICVQVASLAAFTSPASSQQAAGEVPRLDVAQTCRAASVQKATQDACLGDEERARAKLATGWGAYPHKDRSECMQMSSMKGFQSYVELLTCLEMAAAQKTLPKDITQQ